RKGIGHRQLDHRRPRVPGRFCLYHPIALRPWHQSSGGACRPEPGGYLWLRPRAGGRSRPEISVYYRRLAVHSPPMTANELRQKIRSGAIDTIITAFPDVFGRLVGKRFDAKFFLEHVAQHGTHACNYLLAVNLEMEPQEGFNLAN